MHCPISPPRKLLIISLTKCTIRNGGRKVQNARGFHSSMATGKKMRGVGYIGYGPERKWRSLVFPNGENRSNPRAKVVTPKTKKVRPLPTSAKARQELIAKMLTLFFSDGHALYNQSVREKFLWKREGFVPIRFLLGFKTISQLAATTAEIVNACKCSCSSELELSIDESSIRRLEPFTKERLEDNIQRAIVLFHLPMKNLKYTITTKAIQEAFECYGPISYVKLRFRPPNETDKPYLRNLRSIPDGVCLVVFKTREGFKKAIADCITYRDGMVVQSRRQVGVSEKLVDVTTMKEFLDHQKKPKNEYSFLQVLKN